MSSKQPAVDKVPCEHGYYWATHRVYRWREIVKLDLDGFRHSRVFVHRMSASFNVEEFEDWKGPLKESSNG